MPRGSMLRQNTALKSALLAGSLLGFAGSAGCVIGPLSFDPPRRASPTVETKAPPSGPQNPTMPLAAAPTASEVPLPILVRPKPELDTPSRVLHNGGIAFLAVRMSLLGDQFNGLRLTPNSLAPFRVAGNPGIETCNDPSSDVVFKNIELLVNEENPDYTFTRVIREASTPGSVVESYLLTGYTGPPTGPGFGSSRGSYEAPCRKIIQWLRSTIATDSRQPEDPQASDTFERLATEIKVDPSPLRGSLVVHRAGRKVAGVVRPLRETVVGAPLYFYAPNFPDLDGKKVALSRLRENFTDEAVGIAEPRRVQDKLVLPDGTEIEESETLEPESGDREASGSIRLGAEMAEKMGYRVAIDQEDRSFLQFERRFTAKTHTTTTITRYPWAGFAVIASYGSLDASNRQPALDFLGATIVDTDGIPLAKIVPVGRNRVAIVFADDNSQHILDLN